MKLLKDKFASNASVPITPTERSPRQCIAPEYRNPRSVCVVNGPFIGWKSFGLLLPLSAVEKPVFPVAIRSGIRLPKLMGMGLLVTEASGFPRSQARSSLSPKMWQLAQEASPFPEN